MNEELITELQDHFDGRGRLKKVVNAIKCYTKDASMFYSYVDGFGKKQYLNIPIEPDEILPILEKYIKNIDKDIIEIATSATSVNAIIIDNASDINSKVEWYRKSFPDTFTGYDDIRNILLETLHYRQSNGDDLELSFQIPVCSDWEDKLYLFSFIGTKDCVAYFHFNDIVKV